MDRVDLIIHNAVELITCAAGGKPKRGAEMRDIGIITDGAVAISQGQITAVGTSSEILSEYSATDTIDADGKVVAPGFVDPHTHIVYAGNRLNEFELKIKGADYLDILAGGGGIISTVQDTRNAGIESLVDQASARLDKMLASGTTTCEIKTGYGLDTASELKMLEAIETLDQKHIISVVPTFLAAHTVAIEFKDRPDEYVDLICNEMLPLAWQWYEGSQFPGKGTAFFCDVFTEQKAFDIDQSKRIMTTAKGLGFAIKAHVDQFTNLGGSTLAIGMGATSVDHLDAISDEEMAMLAASKTVGVLIPTENFSAGKTQFAPARKLVDGGCAIAISTDYNPGSAPCPSQQMAMAIAARYQNLLPAEAFAAATINAAYAIGEGERTGSIETGKAADLLIFEAADHREIVYEFGGPPRTTVIKQGKIVYDPRRV